MYNLTTRDNSHKFAVVHLTPVAEMKSQRLTHAER